MHTERDYIEEFLYGHLFMRSMGRFGEQSIGVHWELNATLETGKLIRVLRTDPQF